MKTCIKPLIIALGAALATPAFAAANTLAGWAILPAATFSDGPTSGQFGFGNVNSPANNPPYINLQPVQGFSAVLAGPSTGTYTVMTDNGFGSMSNSADALLRLYGVKPDWTTHTVSATNYNTGSTLSGFTAASRLTLNDANHKMPYAIQADYTNYYNSASNPLVDNSIKSGRLLTGADLDIESVRRDKNGNYWFGDEFGPFLVKTDANGTVQNVYRTPNVRNLDTNPYVQSPSNPIPTGANNLPGSGGFEGMAMNASGNKLYTLLERPLTSDADQKRLLIQEFDIAGESFTGASFAYKLDADGTNIGDMTAINDHEFLVIERNGGTGTSGNPFKKIFKVDIADIDGNGFAKKTEVVDLMNIADPNDLNGDGSTTFTFPYVTIEDVLILDANTLLVINDNNFPGGGGRSLTSDNTEFLKISLAQSLPVPEPENYAMLLAGLGLIGFASRRRQQ